MLQKVKQSFCIYLIDVYVAAISLIKAKCSDICCINNEAFINLGLDTSYSLFCIFLDAYCVTCSIWFIHFHIVFLKAHICDQSVVD